MPKRVKMIWPNGKDEIEIYDNQVDHYLLLGFSLLEKEKKAISSIFISCCMYSSILFKIKVVFPVPGGPMTTIGLLKTVYPHH